MSDGPTLERFGGFRAWLREVGSTFREVWLPLAIGAAIALGTYALWGFVQRHDEAAHETLAASEAGRIEQEFGRALDARAFALERFAAAHGSWAGTLDADEHDYERAELPFRAVLTLDPELRVLRAVPPEARATSAADPSEDEARTVALRVITEIPGRSAAMVGTVPLPRGGRQLLVCQPVFEGARAAGYLVGVLRVQDLFDEVFQRALNQGFAVAVYEGPQFVYGTQLVDGGPGTDDERETAIARDAVVWRVQVWPADELYREIRSHGPIILFWVGLTLAFFVSLTVHLWREGPAVSVNPAGRGVGMAADPAGFERMYRAVSPRARPGCRAARVRPG